MVQARPDVIQAFLLLDRAECLASFELAYCMRFADGEPTAGSPRC